MICMTVFCILLLVIENHTDQASAKALEVPQRQGELTCNEGGK